ncbi:MAG: hypothetical protein IPJ77_01425 [Planctomycetes bacterium]|nr:hypothetical protein [Planctomycetota bacterium]
MQACLPLLPALFAAVVPSLFDARLSTTVSAPVSTDPAVLVDKCIGFRSAIQKCNTHYCSCATITDTIDIDDGLDCLPCEATGSLTCGTDTVSAPGILPCGQRYTVKLICTGCPGFGCTYNYGVVLICGSCEPI